MQEDKRISYLKEKDNRLSKVIDAVGELNSKQYNQSTDSFFFLVREIVGQMISANVKKTIFSRLLSLCNNELTPNNVCKLRLEELRGIGLSQSKSKYIHNLAWLVAENKINFDSLSQLPDEEVRKELMKIEGIGNWTSKMYLIFFLNREDVLPNEDGAFLQAYKWLYNTKIIKKESIEKRCKKWKPYTSLGAKYLYRALDTGLTKIEINTFLNK